MFIYELLFQSVCFRQRWLCACVVSTLPAPQQWVERDLGLINAGFYQSLVVFIQLLAAPWSLSWSARCSVQRTSLRSSAMREGESRKWVCTGKWTTRWQNYNKSEHEQWLKAPDPCRKRDRTGAGSEWWQYSADLGVNVVHRGLFTFSVRTFIWYKRHLY